MPLIHLIAASIALPSEDETVTVPSPQGNGTIKGYLARPATATGKLPVVLVLGTPGSTKTSSVVRSGLEAELLIGDVFRDDAVVTTRGVNLWFGRNTLFVEPGRDITDDATRWRWFMYRLLPGRIKGALSSGQQAPRVAIVCFSCEGLTAANAADTATAAARALRDRRE